MTRGGSSLSRRLIVLSLLFASQVGLATTQEPTNKRSDQEKSVRLKTELVELRAVVTDKKGNPIADLKKEDFELLENGVRQEIGFFSLEIVQNRPGAARAKDDLQKGKLALSSLFLGREGKSQDRTKTPAGEDKHTAAPTFIIGRASFKSGDTGYYRFGSL